MGKGPEKLGEEENASYDADEVWHFSSNPEPAHAKDAAWRFDLPSEEDHSQASSIAYLQVDPKRVSLKTQSTFELSGANKIGLSQNLRFRAEQSVLDFSDGFKNALIRERELGSLFNFVPVFLAIGIGIYFLIPNEPVLAVVAGTSFVSFFLAWRASSGGVLGLLPLATALVFLGMLAAQIQVLSSSHAVPRSGLTGQVRGLIVAVDQNRRGAPRYLIRPSYIENFSESELPPLIRVSSSKKHPPLAVGASIEGLARLTPISGPAYPGGYDFSFGHWMDGLALTGFFMGAPKHSKVVVQPGLLETVSLKNQQVRQEIAGRIRAGLPGEAGDIAAALITGDRSGLSDETQESLRKSGLAHILAISGLHMALVTLTVIWLARLLLVLVPNLSDRKEIKKWAIGFGFFTATLYMAISGGSIATQRAWLMISVMLIAAMMDRRALTMRSVSIAAIVILCLDPASLFQPGFQMSFAAVAALVVVYQDWRVWQSKRIATGQNYNQRAGVSAVASSGIRYFAGLSATSLIAGFATTLFALWHFHRVAPLSMVSNLLAMPLVSLLVMPLSLLSVVLMPYGFEGLALAPLGFSIQKVVDVSDLVNSYEFDFETGARSPAFLLASAGFLIVFAFLRTRLRWLAVIPLIAVFVLSSRMLEKPDLLIAQDGRNIALRSSGLERSERGDGYTLLHSGRGKFITDVWKRAFIPNQKFDDWGAETPCTKDLCDFRFEEKRLLVVYAPDQIANACKMADILIAPRLWWTRCNEGDLAELIINRTDLETNGAYALYNIRETPEILTAWSPINEASERRPWLVRFDNVSRRFSVKGISAELSENE